MHGADAAEATRLRWDWQHRRNPAQRHRSAGHLGRARRPDGRRALSDAARSRVAEGPRGRRRVGHRRDGRARARSPGPRRSARPRVGSQQRRGAGARASRQSRVSCSIACTGRESHVVPCAGEAADAARRAAAALPTPVNRLISAVTQPLVQVVARSRPLRAECEPIRRFDSCVHRAVGAAGAEVRPGRAPRCAVSELALHRAAARALLGRRAEAAGRGARLRGVPPPARAARPRHDAGRLPRRSRRRVGAEDAAALGRSRGRAPKTRTRSAAT